MGHGTLPGGGGSQGPVRPITPVESVVSVDTNQTVLAAANPDRRNLIIQNQGATGLRVYTTTAGAAGTYLAQYQQWAGFQPGVGCYKGAVYGIRASGTADAWVTEET